MRNYTEVINAYFLAIGIKNKSIKNDFEVEINFSNQNHFIEKLQLESISSGLTFIQNELSFDEFKHFFNEFDYPIIFIENLKSEFSLEIINPKRTSIAHFKNEKISFLIGYPIENLRENDKSDEILSPLKKTIRLISNEKKDILYIYLIAIVAGIINLSLPLGIQSIIGLISTGKLFSSIYVLITIVLIGILVSGFILITQSILVETIQRRIFVKTAIEFTYRIPKLKSESLIGTYAPELMNRFFDILTIQKALPKLLIDFSGAILQIIFGVILLCVYHPYFIIFGILVSLLLYLSIRFNAPKGLETSLTESKYKYKIAQWLQEIARALNVFKLSGDTSFAIEKMNVLINNYLLYREKHFKVIQRFYFHLIFFKFITIGGLLILGAFLVINQKINLGQFVASEIIIVLIVSSFEKLVGGIDSIFDLITGVEKLSKVTEIELDKTDGFQLIINNENEAKLEVKNLSFNYPNSSIKVLNNIKFEANFSEFIAITGGNSSGKETLMKILTGINTTYNGVVAVNNISLKTLKMSDYHNIIEKNFEYDDIFDGTILENITLGRKNISIQKIYQILEILEIKDTINAFPEGLKSQILTSGKRFSGSFLNKISLARNLVSNPKILFLTDNYYQLTTFEKNRIFEYILDKSHQWTVIISTHDEFILNKMDKVFELENGFLNQIK